MEKIGEINNSLIRPVEPIKKIGKVEDRKEKLEEEFGRKKKEEGKKKKEGYVGANIDIEI